MHRRTTARGGMVGLLAALLWGAPGLAQPAAVFSAREPAWPESALGTVIPVDGARPPEGSGVLRSARVPVSVHVGDGVEASAGARVLSLSERALDGLEFRLNLPLPVPDGTHGGDSGTDVYVTREGPEVEAVVDSLSLFALGDSAMAFVRVRWTSDEKELRRRVSEGLARAAVLGANADQPRSVVLALGASIARQVTGDALDVRALEAFQSEPWRALVSGRDDLAARGASQWFDFMNQSDDESHRLLGGWVSALVQKTPARAVRLWDEPDVFDLARRTFRDEPRAVAGMLLRESVARAFDPVAPARETRTLRFGSLPTVVSGATEPTGMAVVNIDLADAPLNGALGVWLHASPWRRWIATVVRINRAGAVIQSMDSEVITDGEWFVHLDTLDGFSRAVLVLVDLGDESYDPDLPVMIRGFWSAHIAPRE